MKFTSPVFAMFGLLGIPIILLYMLKLRREKVEVSSTLLWRMALQDRQANLPWQRLKRNLLMMLQLIALVAFVLALVQPAIPGDTISNAQVIVILDSSASMRAVDVMPSRFEAAREKVRGIIDRLPGTSEMTLIQASHEPVVLVSHGQDKAALRAAVDEAAADYGEPNWGAAFALANASITDQDHMVILLSDGNFPEQDISLHTDRFQYIPIGSVADNIGVSAFSVSPSQSGGELFVKVSNYSDTQQTVILSVFRNQELLQEQRIQILPGHAYTKVIGGLPTGTNTYRARLTGESANASLDAYPSDDQAFFVYHPSEAKRILLVTRGNFFLEQFLSVLPDTEAFRVFPDEIESNAQLPDEGFSIFIYDGVFPDELPNGNILLINPPENAIFTVAPVTQDYGQVKVSDHALTRLIAWDQVQIKQTRVIELPEWGEALVTSQSGPLVFIGEYHSRRFAVVAFDLLDSDLPLQITFPILFDQLIRYLNPPVMVDAPDGYLVAEPVQLKPGPSVEALRIRQPDGEEREIELDEFGATFLDTAQPGIYIITALPGEYTEQFAVNGFSEIESHIAPQQALAFDKHDAMQRDEILRASGLKDIWQLPAILALVVLGIEWWVYYRPHVSSNMIRKARVFRTEKAN